MNQKRKIIPGMRTIKTALSVVICIVTLNLLAEYTKYEFVSFYACLTAIFTLQSNLSYSVKRGIHRILGTFIGTFYALLVIYLSIAIPFMTENIFWIFIGIILCIQSCYVLNINEGILIACILFLASVTIADGNYLTYALVRSVETIYGVVIALLVNKYFFPYKQ